MFKPRHPYGGKNKGTMNKSTIAREQLQEKLELLGRVVLAAEELESLTPLAVMRLWPPG